MVHTVLMAEGKGIAEYPCLLKLMLQCDVCGLYSIGQGGPRGRASHQWGGEVDSSHRAALPGLLAMGGMYNPLKGKAD